MFSDWNPTTKPPDRPGSVVYLHASPDGSWVEGQGPIMRFTRVVRMPSLKDLQDGYALVPQTEDFNSIAVAWRYA